MKVKNGESMKKNNKSTNNEVTVNNNEVIVNEVTVNENEVKTNIDFTDFIAHINDVDNNNVLLYSRKNNVQFALAKCGVMVNGNSEKSVPTDAYIRFKNNTQFQLQYSAGALLARDKIRSEIQAQIQAVEDKKTAKKEEIFQFYTSVMRGEVLDQFGIEASLDTRIKAANELAKYQIELPMKLEQKNITNNIGSITLNFLPRNLSNNNSNGEIESLDGEMLGGWEEMKNTRN